MSSRIQRKSGEKANAFTVSESEVTTPTWYLAEGSSAWGFECWLLIQNPNATEATAQVTYMIEDDTPQTFEKKIPAQSRKTYNMANDIGAEDASLK